MKGKLIIIIVWSFFFVGVMPRAGLCAQGSFHTVGYSLGIRASQLISDHTLYKPSQGHGGFVGMETGTIMASPIMQLSRNLLTIDGFFKGIQTSQIISRFEEQDIKHIGKEIQLLSEVYNALVFDLVRYLNRSVDRQKSLDDHITYLIDLAKRENAKIDENVKRLSLFTSQNTKNIRQINELEKLYFDLSDNYHAKRAEDVFLEFLELSEKNIKIKALLGSFQLIQRKHEFFYPLLLKRIKAIRANREALLRGIRVIDIEEVDLGIIEKVSL